MGKGFSKFKRKLRVGAIIRALLCGLSLGTATLALLWLADKLTATQPDFVAHGLCAGIVAVLSFAAVWLILLPTRKRIARRVDRQLALGEKVQTMVEFRHDESAMAVLQREDTDRILRETKGRRVKGVCTWLFLLMPVIAVTLLAGTVLVPAKEPTEPPPAVDNNFSLTPWQEQALKDLIEKVRTSDMEATPKEGTVKQLESLLIKLRNVRKETAMKEAVIATVEGIHGVVSEYNTYDLIASAMYGSPSKPVQELGSAIDSLKPLLVGEWTNTTKETLAENPAAAVTLASGIRQALTLSKVDASNEVCIALSALAEGLEQVTAETPAEVRNSLLWEAEEALDNALFIQAVNEEVEDDTIYTLLSIFGIKASELPDSIFNDPDDPRGEGNYEPDENPDKLHSGGMASGEMIFGSNDTIYDPEREDYVTYGEVIDGYFARITEMLVDGQLSAEMEEALSDYFAYLFNGTENKKNNTVN